MPNDIYIFVGPPGSGKGSLSALCTEKLNWEQLSTGNLCRKHIALQTPYGKEIDFAIKSGKLVSDELITEMVFDWFDHRQRSEDISPIILDGYPRTVEQAKTFNKALKDRFKSYRIIVIQLDVNDEIAVERISGRCICTDLKCQAVYSCVNGSSCQAKKAMSCDRCSSPLVRREDDTKEIITERLAVYHTHAAKLRDYFNSVNIPIEKFDAGVSLSELFDALKNRVLHKVDNGA